MTISLRLSGEPDAGATRRGVVSTGAQTFAGVKTFTSNPVVTNAAPSLALTDTTASAKSLTVAVDANLAQLRESAGASGSLLTLDLANSRLGLGTAAPQRQVHLSISSGATVTQLALENTDTTAANGSVISFRSATTGSGAASFVQFAGIQFAAVEHDNATGVGAVRLFGSFAGTYGTVVLALNGLGVCVGGGDPADGQFTVGSNLTRSSWTTAGPQVSLQAATFTDSTGSGTIALRAVNSVGTPTLASSSAVTLTDAATWYIAGGPTAGANTTVTNKWALYIAGGTAGNLYLDGSASLAVNASGKIGVGAAPVTDKLEITGNLRFQGQSRGITWNVGSNIATTIDLDVLGPTSNNALIRFFRSTNSSATVAMQIGKGNNTATLNHSFAGASDSYVCGDNSKFGVGTNLTPNSLLETRLTDAGTAAVADVVTVGHNSSGTPAAGFGAGVLCRLHSSTTVNTNAGRLSWEWVVATHASRTARGKLTAYDTAERECVRVEASGSAAMVGFLGAAAVVRQNITGSRGGNAALASALTGLASLGLITDSTTA